MTRAVILLSALSLSACVQGVPTEADISVTRGASLFAQSCAVCHGADARGKIGPDLTGLALHNDGEFPRDRVMAQIDGYGAGDRVMPEFGAEGLGDTVIVEHQGLGTPVPADLLALTNYLESIQR